MKRNISLILSLMFVCSMLAMTQLAYADNAQDNSSTSIASADKTGKSVYRKHAAEISKQKSENAKEDNCFRQCLTSSEYIAGMNNIEQKLFNALPYEVQKQMTDIPRGNRIDWMIDKLVERKAPWFADKLCQDKEFKKKYESAPREKRIQMLKESIKKYYQKEAGQNQKQVTGRTGQQNKAPEFLRKMDPQKRKLFMRLPPEKKLDVMAEKMLRDKGGEIRKHIQNNPELRKKIEKLPPEKRRVAIRNTLKKKIAARMKARRERQGTQWEHREGQKRMQQEHMPRMQMMPQMQIQLKPETREKLLTLPPEKRADFLVDKLLREHGEIVKDLVKNHPGMVKRLEQLPPDKKHEAIRNIIKRSIAPVLMDLRGDDKSGHEKQRIHRKPQMKGDVRQDRRQGMRGQRPPRQKLHRSDRKGMGEHPGKMKQQKMKMQDKKGMGGHPQRMMHQKMQMKDKKKQCKCPQEMKCQQMECRKMQKMDKKGMGGHPQRMMHQKMQMKDRKKQGECPQDMKCQQMECGKMQKMDKKGMGNHPQRMNRQNMKRQNRKGMWGNPQGMKLRQMKKNQGCCDCCPGMNFKRGVKGNNKRMPQRRMRMQNRYLPWFGNPEQGMRQMHPMMDMPRMPHMGMDMPGMNPEMHEMMIRKFMEDPDMLRGILESLPMEFKHMLREFLEEDFRRAEERERHEREMREREELKHRERERR